MKKAILAVLIVLSLIAITGCNTVENGADNAREGAEDVAENVRDGAEDAADNVREGAEDLADNVRDGAEDAADNVRDFFNSSGTPVGEVAADAREDTDKLLEKMQLTGKANVDIIAEDPSTISYGITIIDNGVETSESALANRADMTKDDFNSAISDLREKSVEDPRVVVTFMEENGDELYRTEYK